MAMTFPIDKVDPIEIPAFRVIFDMYGGDDTSHLSSMLKYLCYRFDPKHEPESVNFEQRKAMAMDKSGFVGPGDPPCVNEDGVLIVPPRYRTYMDVTSLFFAVLNNPDWEEMCSLEFMVAEAHQIMRSPIPDEADTDVKSKMSKLKFDLAGLVAETSDRLRVLVDRMASGDEDAKKAIEASAVTRKVRDATGRVKT